MRRPRKLAVRKAGLPPLFFLLLCIGLSSCVTQPTDMRTLVPAETLVYLETNDLAAALQPIADSKPFKEVATKTPDLSAFQGVQVAITITGFETSVNTVKGGEGIARIRPIFVAVIETHASSQKAVAFAKNQLNSFFNDVLNNQFEVRETDRPGGKYFEYEPILRDGRVRKGYAFVTDSLIYFGNDSTAIEKCLGVKRGETESLANTGKFQPLGPATLGSGYVSTDGVGNIASIIGVKFASESSQEKDDFKPELAEMIAGLIRGSATEIRWNSTRTNEGIVDAFTATLPAQKPTVSDEIMTELIDSLFEEIESASAAEVIDVLAERGPYVTAPNTVHRREDHFTATTAERRLTSDLGFLAWIIAQMAGD